MASRSSFVVMNTYGATQRVIDIESDGDSDVAQEARDLARAIHLSLNAEQPPTRAQRQAALDGPRC